MTLVHATCSELPGGTVPDTVQLLPPGAFTAHDGRSFQVDKAPVQRPVQPSQHLREHRPGRPKKLAADPELRAFVEARFNRMTFDQIADDVAQNFPPERQVKRSAIHDWYRRVYKRKYPADPG